MPIKVIAIAFAALFVLAVGQAWAEPPAPQAGAQTKAPAARRLPPTIVMLESANFPSPVDLEAAIKKRLPEFRLAASPRPGAMLGTLGNRLCILMFVGAPNPLDPDESFIKAAWWWPNVQQDVAKRKAHVIVSIGDTGDPQADHVALAKLVASVMESSPAIGVIWDGADAVWPRQMFIQGVDQAADGIPIALFVSVKLGRDTQFAMNKDVAWLGMTYGLRVFGLKEVEFRGFEGEAPELVSTLLSVASYLVRKGDVIKSTDTFGETLERQYWVKIEPSTLEPGKDVYRVRALTGVPRAKPSQVVR